MADDNTKGRLAQLVERVIDVDDVTGSTPVPPTMTKEKRVGLTDAPFLYRLRDLPPCRHIERLDGLWPRQPGEKRIKDVEASGVPRMFRTNNIVHSGSTGRAHDVVNPAERLTTKVLIAPQQRLCQERPTSKTKDIDDFSFES